VAYQVEITPPALKQLERIDRQFRTRILATIERLSIDPRPQGCKQLTGWPGYRIRVGDYRALYRIDDAAKIVWILEVGHRREVYR
jgi:mRNA interferase RelE/StbE